MFYVSGSSFPGTAANNAHSLNLISQLAMYGDIGFYYRGEVSGEIKSSLPHNIIYRPYIKNTIVFWFKEFRKINKVIYTRNIRALIGAILSQKRVCLELHHLNFGLFTYSVLSVLFLLGGRRVKVVVISDALKIDLEKKLRYCLSNSVLVLRDAGSLCSEPKKIEQIKRFGYVGSGNPGKGVERILILAQRLPEYQFLLFGDIVVHDVPANVTLMGFVDPLDIDWAYKSFDVALAPYSSRVSYHGSKRDIGRYMSPLKVFESWGQGVPIVISSLPALMEFATEDTVIFADPDDDESWFQVLSSLEVKHLNDISKNAFKCLKESYTWSKRAETIYNICSREAFI